MRWSAAEAYLRPARKRSNLTVRTGSLVTKVIVERGRAIGVEVADAKGRTERLDAVTEVVLAGGAFNTPALLQHSGIGPADHLRSCTSTTNSPKATWGCSTPRTRSTRCGGC
jgi:choline dehydrogenase